MFFFPKWKKEVSKLTEYVLYGFYRRRIRYLHSVPRIMMHMCLQGPQSLCMHMPVFSPAQEVF